jgi:hypothetical protein
MAAHARSRRFRNLAHVRCWQIRTFELDHFGSEWQIRTFEFGHLGTLLGRRVYVAAARQ